MTPKRCYVNILYTQEDLYKMIRVSRLDTRLPYDIWIDSLGKYRNLVQPVPQLKVDVHERLITMSISKMPEILTDNVRIFESYYEVCNWIIRYYDLLIKH